MNKVVDNLKPTIFIAFKSLWLSNLFNFCELQSPNLQDRVNEAHPVHFSLLLGALNEMMCKVVCQLKSVMQI